MNREILFRGKRVDNGEWVEGDLVINRPSSAYRIFKDFANVKHGDYTESGLHECSGLLYNIIPESVGQFTGLCDKNGKRIFEGDVLAAIQYVKFKKTHILAFEMKFETRDNNANGWTQFSPISEFEIIGNIYDNPELLTNEPNNQKR